MTPLQAVDRQLEALASVVDVDMQGALDFIEALREVFGTARRDVLVSRAVLELEHAAAGYPIGHVVFDGEVDLYKFIPHIDNSKEA